MAMAQPPPSSPRLLPRAPAAVRRRGRIVTPPLVVCATPPRAVFGFAPPFLPSLVPSIIGVVPQSRGGRHSRLDAPSPPPSPAAFPVVENLHVVPAAVPPALLLIPTFHVVQSHCRPWPPSVSRLWASSLLTAATPILPARPPPARDAVQPPSPCASRQPSPTSAHFSRRCRRPFPVGAATCPGCQALRSSRRGGPSSVVAAATPLVVAGPPLLPPASTPPPCSRCRAALVVGASGETPAPSAPPLYSCSRTTPRSCCPAAVVPAPLLSVPCLWRWPPFLPPLFVAASLTLTAPLRTLHTPR